MSLYNLEYLKHSLTKNEDIHLYVVCCENHNYIKNNASEKDSQNVVEADLNEIFVWLFANNVFKFQLNIVHCIFARFNLIFFIPLAITVRKVEYLDVGYQIICIFIGLWIHQFDRKFFSLKSSTVIGIHVFQIFFNTAQILFKS